MMRSPDETRVIQRRIAAVVFGVLGIFLFSSELMNAIFNNRLDGVGARLGERILFAFKPTVVAIYVVFATLLYLLIMRYLRPLMSFLRNGTDYDQARTAAINVPWVIIVFQLTAWTLGTTLYYALKGWEAESGIPVWFGLPLKIAVGFPAGVYTSILFNLILIPAKERLRIAALGDGEEDRFSRNRDYWVVAAILVFVVVNFAYVAYYFALSAGEPTFAHFYLPMIGATVFYAGVSFGLIALSKREYFLQIDSIRSILQRMAVGDRQLDSRINIINYNELGEIAGYANLIVDNFADILRRISESAAMVLQSSQTLSSASRQNAAYANEQASSTAEIVTTMEEVNSHSNEIGSQAKSVEDAAQQMKQEIGNGNTATKRTIEKMEAVRNSNAETIRQVRNLDEHIRNIWEIVKIINGIAGQIKIIAFNATLEAASAGEAGKNFEIVATEIRRLADNTVASTAEIRSRIEQIQSAADALIDTSRADSEHITEAWTLAGRQESTLELLLGLSESSSEAAGVMNRRVSQQIGAFEQVLMTLKQISAGVHEFSDSIEDTNRTADSLNETVGTLNQIASGEET